MGAQLLENDHQTGVLRKEGLAMSIRRLLLSAIVAIALIIMPTVVFANAQKEQASAQKTSWKIGVSMGSLRAEWWSIMYNGIKDLAAKHPEIKLITTDAGGDTQKQISDVNDLITQGVDLLLLFPNESAPLGTVAKSAMDKGIPVFDFDIPVPDGDYTQIVAGDHYGCGQNDAAEVVKLLTAKNGSPKGQVFEITGVEGTLTVSLRTSGFEDYLKKYPDIKIVAKDTAAWFLDKSYAMIKNFLVTYPNVDAIYFQNDNMALGGIKALQEANLAGKVYTVSIDGDARLLQAIKAGTATATSTYSHVLGAMGLDYAIQFLKGQKVPLNVIAPTYLVTKENVDQFYDANQPAYVEPTNPAPAKITGEAAWPKKK